MGEILKCESFGERILSGLQFLQENNLLCDLTLVANDNQAFHVHRAVMAGQKDVVEFLISKGADVNAHDKEQLTPLSWAEQKGYREVADMLLKHGGHK